jgi:dTDP-4-amino-4,6-dideoxygalactose transaminase
MTEVQAAIGRIQLRKLRDWVTVRQRNARLLRDGLSGIESIRIPNPPPHIEHAYYRFYFFIEPRALKASWSRDRIIAEVSDAGIPCFSGSCSEVYLEKALQGFWNAPHARLPIARELGETSVATLVHPTLSTEDMSLTCDVVTNVLRRAAR